MSKIYSTANNKQQNNPKVAFEQYLYHASEPADNMYGYSSAGLGTAFREYSHGAKHWFRHVAQRFRNR